MQLGIYSNLYKLISIPCVGKKEKNVRPSIIPELCLWISHDLNTKYQSDSFVEAGQMILKFKQENKQERK